MYTGSIEPLMMRDKSDHLFLRAFLPFLKCDGSHSSHSPRGLSPLILAQGHPLLPPLSPLPNALMFAALKVKEPLLLPSTLQDRNPLEVSAPCYFFFMPQPRQI